MESLYQRIERLTDSERSELARLLDAGNEDRGGQASAQLVAYVVTRQGVPVDRAELRAHLKERLPEFMIPSCVEILESLPRTPNGKVNHEALPEPVSWSDLNESFVAPRNAVEEQLAAIWASVLGVDRVSVHDNFFESGGDSILSIQIVAKARQAGLRLNPGDLLENQTIARLATIVGTDSHRAAEQGAVSGPFTLTPIQHWFFEQPLPHPHHWHQTLILDLSTDVDLSVFRDAIQDVLMHHDALRACFTRDGNGWRQTISEQVDQVPIAHVDLSTMPELRRDAALAEASAAYLDSLELAKGPMVQVVTFDLGERQSVRVLVGIHHLVVDLISWQILLEDLETAYAQRRRGETVRLPRKTSSYKNWSDALAAHANSDDLAEERAFWLSQSDASLPGLPVDRRGTFTEASASTISTALSVEETQSLLKDVPSAYNTQTEDVLLTALVQAFCRWTGAESLVVGLERHGRDEIGEGLDLSRTVGWFTSYFPVLLSIEEGLTDGSTLISIKEQLRRIPGQGIGYGLLRYARRPADIPEAAALVRGPEVLFSYAGRAGVPTVAGRAFQPIGTLGISRSPSNARGHLIEINAFVAEEQMQLHWTYSSNVHDRDTLQRVTDAFMASLRSLVAHCLTPEAGRYTPSDFPEAGLDQDELDRFVDRLFS